MKNIFLAVIALCFATAASAQIKPDLLAQRLNNLRLQNFKADTSISKLLAPTLTPGNYFKQGLIASVSATSFNSHMPVKHLSSADNMPVAKVSAQGFNMPVKTITVNPPR